MMPNTVAQGERLVAIEECLEGEQMPLSISITEDDFGLPESSPALGS